ncbi:MAG: LysE family translocator [Bacteroidaceae bacterium]|nr:LysE family translocator [Bacteroidaceae bacterium]
MMWIQHVDAIDLIVKGLVIGMVVSAPMGPVGVLTVQRTLNKGRWYGFATGLGAAVSDVFYALVTGLGMSFVMEFVERPRNMYVLQLTGAVMLFLFGCYTYRSNPVHAVHPVSGKRGTLFQNGLTGFLVTLSNPLIVFLFVALYARFAFVVPDHPMEMGMGYLAIVAGSLLWWYGLTYSISKVRTRFDMRGVLWLNRIIGIVVMVFSALGFYFTLRGKSLY